MGIADFYEDRAPETCNAVWAALPLCGELSHANFSGEEVSFPVKGLIWRRENQLYETQPGDFGYFVEGPAICLYYGDLRVISPGSVFARITENLEGIQKVARSVWKERGIMIRLERIEG